MECIESIHVSLFKFHSKQVQKQYRQEIGHTAYDVFYNEILVCKVQFKCVVVFYYTVERRTEHKEKHPKEDQMHPVTL